MASLLGDKAESDKFVNRELVKQAVMTRIQCACGNILDMRTAVLVYVDGHPAMSCPQCWDGMKEKAYEKIKGTPVKLEVIDARDLYPKKRRTTPTV